MKYTKEQIIKLKEAYHFISEFKKLLEKLSANNNLLVNQSVVMQYVEYIQRFDKEIPGIIKKLNISEYIFNDPFGGPVFNGQDYRIDSLTVRIIMDISILKSIIDTEQELPIIPTRDFGFVGDELKTIVERDYNWINKCLLIEAWKPVIVLSGSLIEALLLNVVKKDEEKAKASSKAPNENNLLKWDLNDLINVSIDLQLVNNGVEKLGHGVREYRNLIHPGNELRSELKMEPEEAKIAVEILNMIIRDLSKTA